MPTREELLQQYGGEIVPRAFNAGFVVLSYVVSLTGAASTLELINRRTSRNGLANHVILLSAAVTMGGIAIWCMHYIGNRAIVLAHDEVELQIAYSSVFTALSFFIPILVLLAAFVAIGANNKITWWRICGGGSLAGAAICGMHYLGNASIDNYSCIYEPVNVVGSALIAVAASIVSLSLFFASRASWTNSWWKRGLSAVVLACAVSGMHWCAATGTNYRLLHLNESNQLSRNTTVIVVICLSVSAAFTVAGVVVYTTRVRRGYASKAQQVVLAAAIFDGLGRILVNPDGLLPSEKITDTYVERTPNDTFSIAHPLFHWMFQASRNWSAVSSMTGGMTNHLAQLPKNGRDRRIRLINEDGQLIESYDVIFRELFCLAAVNLADKMKEQLINVGILWDDILPTGTNRSPRRRHADIDEVLDGYGLDDLSEKGESWSIRQQEYGRGSLMFLVRRLEHSHEVDKLEAAGFRFADVQQVCGIIGASMQIKTKNLGAKLMSMATYAEEDTIMEPGVHLGFFGVKARVGTFGFDILVEKGARNLLPAMQLPFERLEPWQTDIIRQLDRTSPPALLQKLDAMKKLSPRERLFACQLSDVVEALHAWIDNPIFDESLLTSKVVRVPCRARKGTNSANTCTMITLRLIIPIHTSINSQKCELVPLNFFKVHQMVYKDSPQHAAFSRSVHRELSPIVNAVRADMQAKKNHPARSASGRGSRLSFLGNSLDRLGRWNAKSHPVDAEGKAIPTDFGRKLSSISSTQSSSTMKIWSQHSDKCNMSGVDATSDRSTAYRSETHNPNPSTFGGILVSQEIQVDVREFDDIDDGTLNGQGQPRYQRPQFPDRRSSQPVLKTERVTVVKGGPSAEFEMKSLSKTRAGVHAGPTHGATVVESDNVTEVVTFVDELFAICVDER